MTFDDELDDDLDEHRKDRFCLRCGALTTGADYCMDCDIEGYDDCGL